MLIGASVQDLASRRQDAAFAREMAGLIGQVTRDAMDNGNPADAASQLLKMAELLRMTRSAAVDQSHALLQEATDGINASQLQLHPAPPPEVKTQSMHVCPPEYRALVNLSRPVGQLIVTYGPEEAIFSDGSLPPATGLTSMEHHLTSAALAMRSGRPAEVTAELQAVEAALPHLQSCPTAAPIEARRFLTEQERYHELTWGSGEHLSDPVDVHFVANNDPGHVLIAVPDTRRLAMVDNLPPHLDVV